MLWQNLVFTVFNNGVVFALCLLLALLYLYKRRIGHPKGLGLVVRSTNWALFALAFLYACIFDPDSMVQGTLFRASFGALLLAEMAYNIEYLKRFLRDLWKNLDK